jgi:histidyl-tRNA synthetase
MDISYQIDIASGRGFEYYTGVMFQFLAGGESIGGGGRYDALIPLMGGRDIPASGFAIYFDRLMSLVKPEALVESPAQRVLVKAEPGESLLKEAFGLADYLRNAGYTVDVDLGGQEPAGLKWLIVVQSKTPLFVLTKKRNNQRYEVRTQTDVLKTIRK